MSADEVYTKIKLKNLKRAKLRQKEKELELHHKNGADNQTIYQTMKDINKLQRELSA